MLGSAFQQFGDAVPLGCVETPSPVGGGVNVNCTTDALALTSYAATVNAAIAVTGTTDALAIASYAATVNVTVDVNVNCTTDTLALTSNAATVNAATAVTGTTDALAIASYAATVNVTGAILCLTANLTLTEHAAVITHNREIICSVDSFAITVNPSGVSVGASIGTTTYVANIIGLSANVRLHKNIDCALAVITIAEYTTNVGAENMPTVTVNTDGGGDYTTLAAAIAGEARDMAGYGVLTINCVGTAVDTSLVSITGYTNTDASNYIDIVGNGVYKLGLSLTVNDIGINFYEPYTQLRKIIFENTNAADPGGQTHMVRVQSGATYCKIKQCIFKGADPATGSSQFGIRSGGYNLLVQDTLIYGFESSGTCYGLLLGATDYAVNCTVIGDGLSSSSRGIEGGHAINCYSSDTNFPYRLNESLTNCASSDTSGSAGLQSIAANSSTFLNPAADDYTLAAGSPLISAGVGPSVNNNVSDADFEDDPRVGAVTDIGFDLLVDVAAPSFTAGPSASNIGARQMNINSTINENGTIAVVVLTGAAQPQPNTATFDGVEVTVSANVANVQTKTGLNPTTTYTIWVRAADFADNYTYASFEQATVSITPVISTITALRSGEATTITGVDFNATQGGGTVKFNNVTCAITAWSDTSITFTAPNNNLQHKNTYDLTVTHDNTNSATENNIAWLPPTGFSYAVAPIPAYPTASVWSSIIGAASGVEIVYETIAELSTDANVTSTITIGSDGVITVTNVNQNGAYLYDYYLIDVDSVKSNNGTAVVTLTTSGAADTVPDQFDFGPPQSGLDVDVDVDFGGTVSGADNDIDLTVSLTNATISVNGGAFTAGPTTIRNGQSYIFRAHTSASESITTVHTLNIGGISDSISLTTGSVTAQWTGLIPAQASTPGAAITPLDLSVYVNNPNSAAFSATGLPTGLSIDANTGVVSGTPTVNQSVAPVIIVAGVSSNAFEWVISGAVFVTTIPDQTFTIGDAVSVNLDNYFQNPESEVYSVDDLPEGVSLSANLITGNPTTAELDTTIVSLGNAASNAFNWTINTAPVFTSSSTLTVVQDATETLTLTATDAESDPVTFSVSGAWPAWATLSGGVITVQPSQAISAGNYNITVDATDGVATVSQVITVTVVAVGTLPIGGFAGPLALERVVYGANAVIYKDPEETLDYWVDCNRRLGSDYIQTVNSVTISPNGALTNNGDYLNAYLVSDAEGNTYKTKSVIAVWLSGGTLGETYLININYTTAAGRTYDVDLWVRCMQDVNAI